MKNTFRFLGLLLVGVFASTLVTHVNADHFPRSDAHAVRSLKVGVGVASLPILRRRAVGTPDANMSFLTSSVLPPGYRTLSVERRNDRIRAQGNTWHLDVFGDGTAAEFFDETAQARAHASGVAPDKAMPVADLEAAGRAFISQHLARVISLQPGERLVPEVKSARIESGIATNGTSATTIVAANRIVFTREINGVPVLGAGSKVTITFLNDGSLESFRYDWPRYVRTGRTQRMTTPQQILGRVQRVVGIRTSYVTTDVIHVPSNLNSTPQPISLGGNMKLERLDCGYYDAGFMSRDANAPVQAGCYYHVTSEQSGQFVTRAAYSGAVPAAKRPRPDHRWPEIALLRGSKVRTGKAPRSGGPRNYVQPVPPRPIRPEIVP